MGMKRLIWSVLGLALAACAGPETTEPEAGVEPQAGSERVAPVTVEDQFAILALDCVHREYPNKISHVLQSDADARPPRELTPAFYGCFDWHSSVHGHWLLTRILTTRPDSVYADEIRAKLAQSFTAENMAGELAYYTTEGRAFQEIIVACRTDRALHDVLAKDLHTWDMETGASVSQLYSGSDTAEEDDAALLWSICRTFLRGLIIHERFVSDPAYLQRMMDRFAGIMSDHLTVR